MNDRTVLRFVTGAAVDLSDQPLPPGVRLYPRSNPARLGAGSLQFDLYPVVAVVIVVAVQAGTQELGADIFIAVGRLVNDQNIQIPIAIIVKNDGSASDRMIVGIGN